MLGWGTCLQLKLPFDLIKTNIEPLCQLPILFLSCNRKLVWSRLQFILATQALKRELYAAGTLQCMFICNEYICMRKWEIVWKCSCIACYCLCSITFFVNIFVFVFSFNVYKHSCLFSFHLPAIVVYNILYADFLIVNKRESEKECVCVCWSNCKIVVLWWCQNTGCIIFFLFCCSCFLLMKFLSKVLLAIIIGFLSIYLCKCVSNFKCELQHHLRWHVCTNIIKFLNWKFFHFVSRFNLFIFFYIEIKCLQSAW